MSNSSLVQYTKISPNRNSPKNHAIDTITPHCYVGQASVEDMGAWFAQPSAQASSNYGIGADGRVGMYVEEGDRAWCTSSRDNDNRAVTIECACDKSDPYKINVNVYASLISLMTDICIRNGKNKLIWFGDKAKTLAYTPKPNEMLVSAHRWFDNKACPGQYIYDRLDEIVAEVNNRLGSAPEEASGIPQSKEWFIETVGSIASELMKDTNILASVVTAQACLETGFGLGSDALELVKVSNILGMKSDLINNTWKQFSVWDGKEIRKVTPEYQGGQLVYVTDYFRVYKDYASCLEDYEAFLLHVRNNKGYKYSSVAGMTDPAAVIRKIRIGTGTEKNPEGYCTDPEYETKVLKIIRDYDLTRFDNGKVIDRYAVRRSFDDTKYQLGLFHILQNAKNMADINWGYKVYDTETKELVYEPQLLPVEKFIATLVEMNVIVCDDIADKEFWTYENKNTSEISKTFDQARKDNNRKTNCVSGVQWALLKAGVVSSNRDGIQWYGNKGIVWVGKDAEKNARKYFDIIHVGNKSVKQCISNGIIQPGDIITYKTLAHTNVFIGNDMAFDTGHANCNGSGEGAKFIRWIGAVPYQGYVVADILRLKKNAGSKVMYRVQVNAYQVENNAKKFVETCKARTGLDAFYEKGDDGLFRVYCGSFSERKNAEERLALVQKSYPQAFIAEVSMA